MCNIFKINFNFPTIILPDIFKHKNCKIVIYMVLRVECNLFRFLVLNLVILKLIFSTFSSNLRFFCTYEETSYNHGGNVRIFNSNLIQSKSGIWNNYFFIFLSRNAVKIMYLEYEIVGFY